MYTLNTLNKQLILQYLKDGILYGSEDHFIWKSLDGGRSWSKVSSICAVDSTLKNSILRSSLVRKFRRNIGISNLLVLKTGTIISQYDKIYRHEFDSAVADIAFDFNLSNVNSPLKNGMSYSEKDDTIYFGEYIIERPRSVKIMRGYNDGRNWEIAHQFSSGEIRHVHGIYVDPHRDWIWVCVGDSDQESSLYYTDDNFKTLRKFGGGDQSWRMVSLIIKEDAIFYGTDAGQDAQITDQNYIYRIDMKTGKRDRLQCIDNPAYYSCELKNGTMCIATTYEPKIKRQTKQAVSIWISTDGQEWKELLDFKYDLVKRSYGTKYGTILFPRSNKPLDNIYCSLLNVSDYDFKSIKVELTT